MDIGADEWAIPGDSNGDADVDFADFWSFQRCFSGPDNLPNGDEPSADCLAFFDFDNDTDIDRFDFDAFLAAFTGPTP